MSRGALCKRIGWTAAIGLGGLLTCGCGSPPPPSEQRAEVEARWAQTLGQLRALEALELDRRISLGTQQVALLEREQDDAARNLIRTQGRKRALLAQMETQAGRLQSADPNDPTPDWSNQLRTVQEEIGRLQLQSVQLSRRLVDEGEELARLHRLKARQEMLTRLAGEQERQFRELDERAGRN